MKNREEVWRYEASFHGKGEWFNVFQHSKEKLTIEDSGMILLATDNLDQAKNKV